MFNTNRKDNIFLAPMAGITDLPFRLLCYEQKCEFACAEMVSAKAMYYNDEKTKKLYELDDKEEKTSIQIFGSEPELMARAAETLNDTNAYAIDINMGCPANKIIKNNEGSALMRDPKAVDEIVRAVKKYSIKPVTVKIRKGWDDDNINAVEIAKIIEAAGGDAIFIHGRTRVQFYSGKADWDIIKKVKSAVSIPVIGNGDIFMPSDVYRMLEETNCDGVMIGRAARGCPWIFNGVNSENDNFMPSEKGIIDYAIRHLEIMIEYKGERKAVLEMRKQFAWYLKGISRSNRLKTEIYKLDKAEEIKKVLLSFIG